MLTVAVRRAVFGVLDCCLLALIMASAAGAAPTWLAPVQLTAGSSASSFVQQVAFDSRGDAIAIWTHTNASRRMVESAFRPAGSGMWQASIVLQPEDAERAERPAIAMTPQGDAIAVWERFTGSGSVIESTTRPSGAGAWQAPVTLSEEGQKASFPQVAIDSNGNAVAAWELEVGHFTYTVQAAVRLAGSGAWQAPVALSTEGQNTGSPRVVMDANGNALVVWSQRGSEEGIQAAVWSTGEGRWQLPVTLSAPGENAINPSVAVDPQGDAVAVWESDSGGNGVEATSRQGPNEIWQTPVALLRASEEAHGPQVAIDSQGDAVAVWQSSTGAGQVIYTASMSAGSGVWQSPVPVSSSAPSLIGAFPQIAMDPRGDAVVDWDQLDGSDYVVEAAVRSAASGEWQPPAKLSPTDKDSYIPQIAIDPQGDAVAIWENGLIEAAGYDAAGPLLSSLAIPGTGTVGQPLSFSVFPLDVWSALGSTSWSFGDGTGTTGTSATHAYAAVGDYNVTVTGTDVLGNTMSATGAVVIGPAGGDVLGNTMSATGAVVIGPAGGMPCACAPPLVRLLYGVHLTSRRFRVARGATAIAAAPLGARFGFTLAAPARLRITITRTAAGLRRHHSCVAPTAILRDGHAKRCTRALVAGTLTRSNEPRGADSIFFSGRIGRRALSPHAYKAVIEARSASAREQVTLAFTIAP